ncbi:MAG: carbamoyltransferase C-terminal domain-containing protein [Actinomycetota bacterium]|nr:carbamoyltransferase C-terminal domain-containing protein [Actinomycetota bacterium]
MTVLGLNHGEYNSSAAIVDAGRVIAGAPEERFSRQKRTKAFPGRAVRYCLDEAGVDLESLDAVAQGWNPGAYWAAYNPLLSGTRVRREDYLYSVPDNLLQVGDRRAPHWVAMSFPGGSALPPIYYVDHHLCHAATSYFTSPFDEAAVFTADWRGEIQCGMLGVGRGNQIETLRHLNLPDSLGMFYATFTQLLGYQPDNDEWKVMALSAFDVDASEEERRIWETLRLTDDGWFEMDQSYYKGMLVEQPLLYTPKLVSLLGGRVGLPGEDAGEWHFRVARAMQSVAEGIAVHALTHLHGLTGLDRVVLGGGFFMNSVFNGKVASLTPFRDVFVPFAPADVGNSIGSALYVEHSILGSPRDVHRSISSIGPQFPPEGVVASLERRGIAFERLADPVADVARLVERHGVVAYFDGRMEFGERALGNRSILADPRPADIKDRINSIIKYREAYRPFAPVSTVEAAATYFDIAPGAEIPFMEKVVPVREEYRDALAAITHVDGSGRLQTLRREDNHRLYDILLSFGELSGYPVLLNTSFNVNGEPIVCTPDDALSTFFNSGLRVLVLGDLVVCK